MAGRFKLLCFIRVFHSTLFYDLIQKKHSFNLRFVPESIHLTCIHRQKHTIYYQHQSHFTTFLLPHQRNFEQSRTVLHHSTSLGIFHCKEYILAIWGNKEDEGIVACGESLELARKVRINCNH